MSHRYGDCDRCGRMIKDLYWRPRACADRWARTMTSANRAGSTDAEVDRPQDVISGNDVAHARGSECALCPGAVEPGGCHPRSCLGFSPCHALASKGIERGRAVAAISGKCSCSAIARTCSSVRPDNATQSSKTDHEVTPPTSSELMRTLLPSLDRLIFRALSFSKAPTHAKSLPAPYV
jgi:hypothetical protein